MGLAEHLREGCGDESCRGSVAPKGFPTAPLPRWRTFPGRCVLGREANRKTVFMGSPSTGSELPWSWQRCLRNEGIPGSSPDGSHSLPLTPRFCRELSLSTAPGITPVHSGLWLSGGGCGFPATAYFGAVGFRYHPRDLVFDSHILSLPRGAVPPAVASCVPHPWEKLQRLTGCNVPLPLSLLTSAFLNLSLPCLCSGGCNHYCPHCSLLGVPVSSFSSFPSLDATEI